MTISPEADPVHAATAGLFRRYLLLIEDAPRDEGKEVDPPGAELDHLAWLCREGIARIDEIPIDKSSRWLGFIQGCLVMRGMVTVEGERDFSRPLFHQAYARAGIQVPPRIEPRPHKNSGM